MVRVDEYLVSWTLPILLLSRLVRQSYLWQLFIIIFLWRLSPVTAESVSRDISLDTDPVIEGDHLALGDVPDREESLASTLQLAGADLRPAEMKRSEGLTSLVGRNTNLQGRGSIMFNCFVFSKMKMSVTPRLSPHSTSLCCSWQTEASYGSLTRGRGPTLVLVLTLRHTASPPSGMNTGSARQPFVKTVQVSSSSSL